MLHRSCGLGARVVMHGLKGEEPHMVTAGKCPSMCHCQIATCLTFTQTAKGQCFQRFIQQMVPKELLDDLVQIHALFQACEPMKLCMLFTRYLSPHLHTHLPKHRHLKVLFSATVLEQVQVLKAATSCSSIVAPCSTTIVRLSLLSQDVLKSARLENAGISWLASVRNYCKEPLLA